MGIWLMTPPGAAGAFHLPWGSSSALREKVQCTRTTLVRTEQLQPSENLHLATNSVSFCSFPRDTCSQYTPQCSSRTFLTFSTNILCRKVKF